MKQYAANFVLFFSHFSWLSHSQLNLNLNAIQYWADEFGKNIVEKSSKSAAVLDIRTDYLLTEVKVNKLDGGEMLKEVKHKLEHMLGKKVQSVNHLVRIAEKSFTKHTYDNQIKFHYFNSKKLNTTEFELIQEEHFNNIQVNLTHSTVHVPTNVYNESVVILNGVAWSDHLNSAFIDNHKNDPTLTWQYFCSSSGFLRNYPGTKWRTNLYTDETGVDTFDCRVRDWYLQAAAYPKDLVVLLDSSGSMRGLRIQIARATVEKLLDTLNDDDFFNIIQYSDSPKYINSCFNGTLIQATDSNKIKAKLALTEVKTQGIAHLDQALIEAFELFLNMEEYKRGALCNKAIMIVTDGAVQNYEEVFAKYNSPRKNIRVFTYLIGREVGDSRDVRSMACKNNGSFSHITSLADVHEHVQEYIHVISRPMIISRANHTSWTNVYSDSHSPGLDMMTTISKPVFDIRKETTNQGILLGVVGTDIPLTEMTKLISNYKIGVNGYSYAITSNGYALFHPRLKPRQPNLSDSEGAFNAVDLSDLEPLDVERKLRNNMVDRKTDSLKLKSFVTYDEGRRARLRDSIYFITDIKDTPFSVGISLPEEYGLYSVDGRRNVSFADVSALSSGDIIIAPWNYCKGLKPDPNLGPLGMMLKILNETKHNYGYLRKHKCDVELLESFVFDAEATRGSTASWVKENHEESFGENSSKNNIEMVFIGTKGGLTRYMILSDRLTDPDFLRTNTSTIEELYYQRAADNGEDVFTFSMPLQSIKSRKDMIDCVITTSTPITVTESDKSAIAAVLGIQMKYSYFAEVFRSASRTFPSLPPSNSINNIGINHTCDHQDLNCYLVDENGFIVFSENSRDVGHFFGSIDGMASFLDEVTIDESDEYNSGKAHVTKFFKKLQMIDNRASCDILDGYGSSSSTLIPGHFHSLLNWFVNIFNEAIIFLLQLDLPSLWKSIVGADEIYDIPLVTTSTDYEVYYEGLDMNDSAVQLAMVECAKLETRIGSNEKMIDCMKEVQRSYKKLPGKRLCTRIFTYYMAKFSELPVSGSVTRCQETCTNSFSVNHVPGTNLMLFVVDMSCTCRNDRAVSFESQEIYYNQSFLCQKMQSDVFRKGPSLCFPYHPMEKTECGKSEYQTRKSSILLLIMILFSLSF